jgi:4a-hydroxytetrahydrobiopterin dehydratase
MSELAAQEIKLCKKGTLPLTAADYAGLLAQLPRWHLITVDGVERLEGTYFFADMAEVAAFSNFIRAMSDEVNHHAFLVGQDKRLTVTWWTHSIGGLHLNDFIMAARCDEAYEL